MRYFSVIGVIAVAEQEVFVGNTFSIEGLPAGDAAVKVVTDRVLASYADAYGDPGARWLELSVSEAEPSQILYGSPL